MNDAEGHVMRRPKRAWVVIAGLLAALALARPVRADEPVTPHAEVLVGTTDMSADDTVVTGGPDPQIARIEGRGLSLGIRAGISTTRWQFTAALVKTSRETADGGLERRRIEIEVGRLVGHPGAARLRLHGGLGVARSRATDAQEAESRAGTNLTLSLGVGGHVPLGDRFFLQPDVSVRALAGGHDGPDYEINVGFGFVLGRRTAPVPPPTPLAN